MGKTEMIELKEFNKFLTVLGFKGVKIPSVDSLIKLIRDEVKDATIQLFDADFIAGKKHLLYAALNALNAFEQGRSISESLEVEMLLYASGQRQISKAIEMIGLKQGTSRIAVAFITTRAEDSDRFEESISKTIPGERDDGVLNFREGKAERLIKTFRITDEELEAVSGSNKDLWESLIAIIIEKIALLAVNQ